MPPLPPLHIAVSNVRPSYEVSLDRGVSKEELAALGLGAEEMNGREGHVSAEATYRHMELMQDRGQWLEFALAAVSRHTVSSLGIVGLACKTVPTVGQALQCHRRYQHLTNRTVTYELAPQGDELWLTEHRLGPDCLGKRLVGDYASMVAVQLLRQISASPVRVLAVHSPRAAIDPAEREQMERFFQAPVALGHEQAVVRLEPGLLSAPVVGADEELADYFRSRLEDTERPSPQEPPWLGQLRESIQRSLATGTPTGQELARSLAMSQRTLQRRLSEEGTTLREMVEQTRQDLATAYLSDPELSLAEVAYLLGYREESSFFRAFRRWTGVTPSGWRRREEA